MFHPMAVAIPPVQPVSGDILQELMHVLQCLLLAVHFVLCSVTTAVAVLNARGLLSAITLSNCCSLLALLANASVNKNRALLMSAGCNANEHAVGLHPGTYVGSSSLGMCTALYLSREVPVPADVLVWE